MGTHRDTAPQWFTTELIMKRLSTEEHWLPKYVSYNETTETIIAYYWSQQSTNLSAFRNLIRSHRTITPRQMSNGKMIRHLQSLSHGPQNLFRETARHHLRNTRGAPNSPHHFRVVLAAISFDQASAGSSHTKQLRPSTRTK